MNKLTTSLALISTMFIAGTVHAADITPGVIDRNESGKITFSGKVVGVTCTLGSQEGYVKEVTLDNVLRSELNKTGKVAKRTEFTIDLTGCDAGDTVQLAFDSGDANIDSTTGNLINKAKDGADGAQIQILNSDNKTINLKTSPEIAAIVAKGKDVSIPLKAQYYAAKDNVTLGDVQTSVRFTLNYK
jgi:major type 1 subunit fimbrin (pilin)